MTGQASQKTGVFPWTEGADFSGPLAVLGLLPAKMVVPSIGAIFMLYAREMMTGPSVPSFFQKRGGGETSGGSSSSFGTIAKPREADDQKEGGVGRRPRGQVLSYSR